MGYNLFKLNTQGLPKLLAGIERKQEWEQKQKKIREMWVQFIRCLPERVPVAYRMTEEVQEADHIRKRLI